MTKKKKKTLVLIDSNALIHRAFHALPLLTKKDGTPSGAVYGYALTLLSVMDQLKPDFIAATFDLPGPTFRHEQYKEYKATRVKAPNELYEQIPIVKDLLRAYGIPIYEKKGYEADDVIGTLTKDPKLEKKVDSIIVTGDLDALQLVDDDTKVFTLRKGIKDTVTYDTKGVMERFRVSPKQIVDYKALRGDASDNIPGVKGIGEKTAVDLLTKYHSLKGVYKNVDNVTPEAVKKKLIDGKRDAMISYDLAKIVTDLDMNFSIKDTETSKLDNEKLASFFQKMEFHSLYKRIAGKTGAENGSSIKRDIAIEEVKTKQDLNKIEKIIQDRKKAAITLAVCDDNTISQFIGIALSVDDSKGYYIPVENVDNILQIIGNPDILKIGYNAKHDLKIYKKLTGNYFTSFFDIQIAAYILNAGTDTSLDKLVFEEFVTELKYQKQKKGQASLLDNTNDQLLQAAAEQTVWIFRLHGVYEGNIAKISDQQQKEERSTLFSLLNHLEMPLVPILAKMESCGVKVDGSVLHKVSKITQHALEKLKRNIHDLADEEFNINSPSQLSGILYEKLKISTSEIKRGKTGFSTNADQLRKIRDFHPIVPLIEEYRELFKVKTTYADALPKLVREDGRIHAHFNQAVTATGRLSSSDPNLQNIPKKGKLADIIRSAFVADEGKMFISADYSQIDLRVAAHLSDDPKLKEVFMENKDIHQATAAWVNNIPLEEVTDRQRGEAKSLNFGILYGMGLYGFMRDSGVSGKQAQNFIDQYMKTFSQLKKYIEKTKESVRKYGYIETEMGRRRYIPNINASNAMFRAAAERMAVNLPVQGLAADIMKLAMIKANNVAARYNKKSQTVDLILQIHDELIFEIDEKIADKFMKDLKEVMEKVYRLKVPLVVNVKKGKNWKELQ
ncbi:MAG: DNA polymerase I [Patescibacteria group bacterium]|nr:DNA polymerase I [Patescibacteria group bacterium]